MLLQCRKINPHNYSPISESWSPKYRCKVVAPKRLCFKPAKAILQNDSRNLLPKVASQTCGSSKLPYKAAPQSCSLKLLPKAVPLRCSTKLQSCGKLLPKVVAARSCQLVWKAVQSCSPKLLPKVVLRCAPKLFSKAVARKLRFCKPVYFGKIRLGVKVPK